MKFSFFISSSNDDPSAKYPLLLSIKALNLLFSILYVGCDKSDIKIFVFKSSDDLLFNSTMLDEKVVLLRLLLNLREVFLSIDTDETVRKSLQKIHSDLSSSYDLYFANGGDQNNKNISEIKICKKLSIGLIDGLGNKIQSSSWLLK